MTSERTTPIAARFRADETSPTRLPRVWPWLIPLLFLLFLLLLADGDDGALRAGLFLGGIMALTALSRAAALLAGLLRRRHEWCAIAPASDDAADLPSYTVLVPLHREAAIIDHLLAAMQALRYPRDRLRVLLLVESDDTATRDALATRILPPAVTVVVVPPGSPRTKPRACNYALDTWVTDDAGFAVIFDAEDRPDPDQLLRAVAAFRTLPDTIVCLQARLAADDRARGLIGHLWGLEYAAWFDLYLPGLHAVGAPIPLGGTSNHFRARHLRQLRWDAWNVTEDAELGIRLARAGLTTGVLDSTTWEDAPATWNVWLRQRSRWLKGWWITAATHLADPGSLRDLGLWRWLWMVHLTLGTVLTHLLLPLALLFAAGWLGGLWPLADPLRPWTWIGPVLATALLLLHLFFLAAHAAAALLRRAHKLLIVVPLLPLAWMMAAVAAWYGYLQSIRQPHYWEKTPHAAPPPPKPMTVAPTVVPLAATAPTTIRAAPPPCHTSPRLRIAAGVALLLVAVLITLWSFRVADLNTLASAGNVLRREQRRAAFVDLTEVSLAPDTDWSAAGEGELVATLTLTNACADGYEAVVWMKLWDGTWFERSVPLEAADGPQTLTLPFDDAWQGMEAALRFAPAWLLRVREVGLRLRGPSGHVPDLQLDGVTAREGTTPPLRVHHLAAPNTAAVNDVWNLRFDLSRVRGNPFDAVDVDLWCTAEGPDGARFTTPCFFVLDHHSMALPDGRERMRPFAAPRWGARIAPDRPGLWRVRLTGHDAVGSLEAYETNFVATPSDLPGPVRVAGRWFTRDDAFFYPLTLNIRSPHDDLVTSVLPQVPQPSDAAGTLALAPWIVRCADHGLNWLRLWTMPGSLGLEWSRAWHGYHGRGSYNLANASRIDHLLDTARARRVTLELALWQHGPWQRDVDPQWSDNPWNQVNGGPLTDPEDVLTDDRLRAAQHNLLRYAAARWGADPALAAWTLWIEVDGATTRGLPDWHREMATALRRYDSLAHPISTEFRTAVGDLQVFVLPEIDFTQVAAYDSGGLMRTFRARADTFAHYDKPLLLEEYGGHSTGGSPRWLAQQIHDGPWAAWVLDIAGSPMAWWWNFIFAERLDRHFARFAAFSCGEDLAVRDWRFYASIVEGAPELEAVWRSSPERAFVWIYKKDLVDVAPSRRQQRNWWSFARSVTRLYEQNSGAWDPLADPPGEQFSADASALPLNLTILRPGRWRYECWDTWTDDAPVTGTFTLSAASPALPLPPLRRDVALKLIRTGE